MGNRGLGGAVFGGGQKRLDCFEVFCACGLEGWNGEGGEGRLISEYRRGIGVDGVAWWRVLRCGGEGVAGFGHDGCGGRRGTLVSGLSVDLREKYLNFEQAYDHTLGRKIEHW